MNGITRVAVGSSDAEFPIEDHLKINVLQDQVPERIGVGSRAGLRTLRRYRFPPVRVNLKEIDEAKRTMRPLGAICAAVAVLVLAYSVLYWARSVNEPAPSSVDVRHIADILKLRGIDVKVSKVLYVNRDFNAYIVVATPPRPSLTGVKDCGNSVRQVDGEAFEALTKCFGLIRWLPISKDTCYLGVVVSSERLEFNQGLPRFNEKWKQATGRSEVSECVLP